LLLLLLLHRSSSNREEQKLSKVNSKSWGKQTRLGSDGKAEEGEGRKTILRSDGVADELTGHASWLYLHSRGPKLEPSIIPSVNIISQAARRIMALPVK
jgi:hypothetical protein